MLKLGPARDKDASAWFRWVGGTALVVGVAALDLLIRSEDSNLLWGGSLQRWVIPAWTAVLYPVMLRRRYPRAVFALMWTNALAGVPLPDYVPFAGLLLALHALGRHVATKWAVAGMVACLVPFAVNAFNASQGVTEVEPLVGFAGILLVWEGLALTAWGSGRLVHMTERRAEQERAEQAERAAAAVRAERLHLARELHDIVSHSVSAMILQAAGARTVVSRDKDVVEDALKAIETTGVQAMGELHRLLGLLRAAASDADVNGTNPLASLHDLDTLVSSARAAGVDTEVTVDGHPSELDRSVGLTAYRLVQEALTNTIKHAGRGASTRIHLRWDFDGLTLTIRDRAGFDAPRRKDLSAGLGLAGLAERINLVGGSLETGPTPDGFLVRAHLPVRPHKLPDASDEHEP